MTATTLPPAKLQPVFTLDGDRVLVDLPDRGLSAECQTAEQIGRLILSELAQPFNPLLVSQ